MAGKRREPTELGRLVSTLVQFVPTCGAGAEVSFNVGGRFVDLVDVKVTEKRDERFVTVVLSERKPMAGKTTTIKGGKGQKPVTFKKGGLHRSTHTPADEKIPASKVAAAKAGKYGPLAKKQANMATGMLAAGRRTAAKGK